MARANAEPARACRAAARCANDSDNFPGVSGVRCPVKLLKTRMHSIHGRTWDVQRTPDVLLVCYVRACRCAQCCMRWLRKRSRGKLAQSSIHLFPSVMFYSASPLLCCLSPSHSLSLLLPILSHSSYYF